MCWFRIKIGMLRHQFIFHKWGVFKGGLSSELSNVLADGRLADEQFIGCFGKTQMCSHAPENFQSCIYHCMYLCAYPTIFYDSINPRTNLTSGMHCICRQHPRCQL